MIYVVYNVETSARIKNKGGTEYFDSKRGATRCKNDAMKNPKNEGKTFEVTDADNYIKNVEQTREVTNLMTGKKVLESVNTPCSVGSESYWCN
jgi:hypothetical protein